jgi:hypothetical protein
MDGNTIEQLQQLVELRDSDAITDAEFNVLKAPVLAGEVPDVKKDSSERPSGGNAAGYISPCRSYCRIFVGTRLATESAGAVNDRSLLQPQGFLYVGATGCEPLTPAVSRKIDLFRCR